MLENSKDLLYIVLSFSVLWVTVFLCWLIYYLVSILRNANEMVEELRERFRGIEDSIRSIRDRMEHATSTLSFVSDGVMRLIQYFISRRRAVSEDKENVKKKKK